jgi:hypothetical protein
VKRKTLIVNASLHTLTSGKTRRCGGREMKKCLHLKKTKPHSRPKPPKVVTWRDRKEAERKAAEKMALHRAADNLAMLALFGR